MCSRAKGCTEVARLVGEVEDLRKMMESLKRMVRDRDWKKKEEKQGIKRHHWKKRRRRKRRRA